MGIPAEGTNPRPGRQRRYHLTPVLPEAAQIDMAKRDYVAGRIEIDVFERRVEDALRSKPTPASPFKLDAA